VYQWLITPKPPQMIRLRVKLRALGETPNAVSLRQNPEGSAGSAAKNR
jgi:hypothetical protein